MVDVKGTAGEKFMRDVGCSTFSLDPARSRRQNRSGGITSTCTTLLATKLPSRFYARPQLVLVYRKPQGIDHSCSRSAVGYTDHWRVVARLKWKHGVRSVPTTYRREPFSEPFTHGTSVSGLQQHSTTPQRRTKFWPSEKSI